MYIEQDQLKGYCDAFGMSESLKSTSSIDENIYRGLINDEVTFFFHYTISDFIIIFLLVVTLQYLKIVDEILLF